MHLLLPMLFVQSQEDTITLARMHLPCVEEWRYPAVGDIRLARSIQLSTGVPLLCICVFVPDRKPLYQFTEDRITPWAQQSLLGLCHQERFECRPCYLLKLNHQGRRYEYPKLQCSDVKISVNLRYLGEEYHDPRSM